MDKKDYGDNFNAHLLEQYKLYVQMADNISSRRQSANSFFLAVNTTIVALVGYLKLGSKESDFFNWMIPVAGMILCFLWYRLIRSYKDLNTAKFKVVHEIERKLPYAMYDLEWEKLGKGENSNLYLPFTHVEIFVPWVFFALHIAVLIIGIIQHIK